jgi:hypothetical protein
MIGCIKAISPCVKRASAKLFLDLQTVSAPSGEERTPRVHPHRSNALDGAAAALTVTPGRVVWQCHCHGLGLISLRAARERLHPPPRILSTVPRKS